MATNQDAEAAVLSDDMAASSPPMGIKVIIREFMRDKLALASLILLVVLLVTIFIWSFLLDQAQVTNVSLWDSYLPPMAFSEDPVREGTRFLLGTDSAGRDIFGLLLIGARNSLMLGWSVALITSAIGIVVGILAAYYAGLVDNILMRIIDFIMILPQLMIIIIFVTIVPTYNVFTFALILIVFNWHGQARFIRGRALTVGRLDFISASRTMGTPSIVIMLREMMPNISSLIIVNLTLNFAGSIGLETGLTFLGFGLPTGTPSLGTLVALARNPDILANRAWVWLPASTLILVLVLCINYVGRALQRSADAKQRLG
ncbi:ABC transporter permease [Alkalibacterium olivapovliticus]|uniref:Peptide/nickel transport system permease protein n=1 Tax=Alkalibacterium olivapovliticus TaxID=99907 RepID=A0A2T0WAU3_9LACT|nr:ABC transporter permease [Alkalibacterium olivapovliticus]PRY83821.1 peptide/nickel transport system permease protein [Alkalibacterium olivapovliticus]